MPQFPGPFGLNQIPYRETLYQERRLWVRITTDPTAGGVYGWWQQVQKLTQDGTWQDDVNGLRSDNTGCPLYAASGETLPVNTVVEATVNYAGYLLALPWYGYVWGLIVANLSGGKYAWVPTTPCADGSYDTPQAQTVACTTSPVYNQIQVQLVGTNLDTTVPLNWNADTSQWEWTGPFGTGTGLWLNCIGGVWKLGPLGSSTPFTVGGVAHTDTPFTVTFGAVDLTALGGTNTGSAHVSNLLAFEDNKKASIDVGTYAKMFPGWGGGATCATTTQPSGTTTTTTTTTTTRIPYCTPTTTTTVAPTTTLPPAGQDWRFNHCCAGSTTTVACPPDCPNCVQGCDVTPTMAQSYYFMLAGLANTATLTFDGINITGCCGDLNGKWFQLQGGACFYDNNGVLVNDGNTACTSLGNVSFSGDGAGDWYLNIGQRYDSTIPNLAQYFVSAPTWNGFTPLTLSKVYPVGAGGDAKQMCQGWPDCITLYPCATPTSTTPAPCGANGCTGTCVWTCTNSGWVLSCSDCTGSCVCQQPDYCCTSTILNQTTRTNCATGSNCCPTCCTTTTGGPTTTLAPCTGTCTWRWYSAFNGYILMKGDCFTLDSFQRCGCATPTLSPTTPPPGTTTTLPPDCSEVTTSCMTNSNYLTTPPPSCQGYCTWYWNQDAAAWVLALNSCAAVNYNCVCDPPTTNGSGCQLTTTQCYGDDNNPCNSTTCSPMLCCGGCVYIGNGSGGWTLQSQTCTTGCFCSPPSYASVSTNETRVTPCQNVTTTTTSTTTTSTTTTTTATPYVWCCYSLAYSGDCSCVTYNGCSGAATYCCWQYANSCPATPVIALGNICGGGACTITGTLSGGSHGTLTACQSTCGPTTTTVAPTTTTTRNPICSDCVMQWNGSGWVYVGGCSPSCPICATPAFAGSFVGQEAASVCGPGMSGVAPSIVHLQDLANLEQAGAATIWHEGGGSETVSSDHFADRDHVVVKTSGGIGDHVTALHVCAGIKAAKPYTFVVLHTDKPGLAEWCDLFGGAADTIVYGELKDNGQPCQFKVESEDRQREIKDRCRLPHASYYAERYGVAARPPEAKPSSSGDLEWATPYAGCVVLVPFAAIGLRSWPLEKWLELEELLWASDVRTVVLDSSAERIAKFRGHKLGGQSAKRVAAVLRRSRATIANDSGIAHVAGALGLPVLVLSAMNPGQQWYGGYLKARWLDGTLPCSPCCEDIGIRQQVGCGDSCFSLNGIEAKAVLDAVLPMTETCLHETLRTQVPIWQPKSYLEIGVREGDSLRLVLAGTNLERLALADNWSAAYGGTGRGSHEHLSWVPSFTRFLDGDSKQTVPTLREQFDLITVDGDHSAEGATADLENVLPLLAPGGRIVFDDVVHPAHTYLRGVASEFASKHPELTIEIAEYERPHGVVVLKRNYQ